MVCHRISIVTEKWIHSLHSSVSTLVGETSCLFAQHPHLRLSDAFLLKSTHFPLDLLPAKWVEQTSQFFPWLKPFHSINPCLRPHPTPTPRFSACMLVAINWDQVVMRDTVLKKQPWIRYPLGLTFLVQCNSSLWTFEKQYTNRKRVVFILSLRDRLEIHGFLAVWDSEVPGKEGEFCCNTDYLTSKPLKLSRSQFSLLENGDTHTCAVVFS